MLYRKCARAKIAFAVWPIYFPRFATNVRLQSKHVATIQSGFIAIPMHNALSRTARAKPIMAALPVPVWFNEWRAKRGWPADIDDKPRTIAGGRAAVVNNSPTWKKTRNGRDGSGRGAAAARVCRNRPPPRFKVHSFEEERIIGRREKGRV